MMALGLIMCVFLSFSVAVMKQDDESNRQRDEGTEEYSYEDNRANFLFTTPDCGGQQEVEHGNWFVLGTSGGSPCLALLVL